MSFFSRFYPKYYYTSVFEIDYNKLSEMGIKALIFDIDNTLAAAYEKDASDETVKLFEGLKASGFKLALLSNNNEKRVQRFNEKLSVLGTSKARKPLRKKITRTMEALGADTENTCIIGDQVFTDIWCGNRKGICSVLVRPIDAKREFPVVLKRIFEIYIIERYLRSRQE